MSGWILFWSVFLVAALLGYSVLVVAVVWRGGRELRGILQSSTRPDRSKRPEPPEPRRPRP